MAARANGGVDLDPSANTLTINVTPVNDAPSGTDKHRRPTTEDAAYTLHGRRFRLQRPDRRQHACWRSGSPRCPAAARSRTTASRSPPASSSPSPTSMPAGCAFTPAPNANGAAYASFTFQVQDNGGTANGGVDLDPTPNTLTVNVTPVNDAPSGTNKTVTTPEDTALHASRRPTSASATSNGNALRGGQDHDAARRRHAHQQRRRGDCRPVHHRRRHQCRQVDVHAGAQRQRRRLCQLHLPGAGQWRHAPTAASISTRRPTR